MVNERKICNLNFPAAKKFDEFQIDEYKFLPISRSERKKIVYTQSDFAKYHRKSKVTGKVIIPKRQRDSIIFKGGYITQGLFNGYKLRKRKFIEDILLVISLLIRRNVVFYSWRHYSQFPALPTKHLEVISANTQELENDLKKALRYIKDNNWQNEYDNGFHLRQLYNHADIFVTESRFLSNFVVWEWLYAHLAKKESGNLREIISYVLNYFWGSRVNQNIYNRKNHNIFTVLRNQLAHNGKIPIDRPYAEQWMKQLDWEKVKPYLDFFNTLTQVIVFKTLGLNCENRIDGFSNLLNNTVRNGKL